MDHQSEQPINTTRGPAWRAAKDLGVDMELLEESLALSLAERLRLHDIAVTRVEQLEAAMKKAVDGR